MVRAHPVWLCWSSAVMFSPSKQYMRKITVMPADDEPHMPVHLTPEHEALPVCGKHTVDVPAASIPAGMASSSNDGCGGGSGRLMVVGGMDATRTRLATVEAYDPREGLWTSIPPMERARASCGLAALGGDLYIVAGLPLFVPMRARDLHTDTQMLNIDF